MNVFTSLLHRVRGDLLRRNARVERGASLVEYAILVGVMAGVVFVAVTLLGTRITDLIDSLPPLPVVG